MSASSQCNISKCVKCAEEEPVTEQLFCEWCEECTHRTCLDILSSHADIDSFVCNNCAKVMELITENTEQEEEKDDNKQNETPDAPNETSDAVDVSNEPIPPVPSELWSQMTLEGFNDVLTGASLEEYLSCEINELHGFNNAIVDEDTLWHGSDDSEWGPSAESVSSFTATIYPDQMSESITDKKQSANEDENEAHKIESSGTTTPKANASKSEETKTRKRKRKQSLDSDLDEEPKKKIKLNK